MTDDTLQTHSSVIILGAGLAGLAAAFALNRAGCPVRVLERDPGIGGLARTVEHQGYRFDLGGHRFITENPQVLALVRDLLGTELNVSPESHYIGALGAALFALERVPHGDQLEEAVR